MEYDGPFKDIVSKVESKYQVIRREESDKYLTGLLTKELNKQHTIDDDIEKGISAAKEYVADIEKIIVFVEAEKGAKAFVDKPEIAAKLYWEHISEVLDRLKANSTLQGNALDVVIAGLVDKFPEPTGVKEIGSVREKFIDFLKTVETFYKEPEIEEPEEKITEEVIAEPTPEPVEAKEIDFPEIKKDITLLTGRYTDQMYLIDTFSRAGRPLHVKEISQMYSTGKQAIRSDIEILAEAGLVNRLEGQAYALAPKGLKLSILEQLDADTLLFLESIARFEGGCLCTTTFNRGRFDGQYKVPSKSALATLKNLNIVKLEESEGELKIIINEDKRKLFLS